MDGQLVLLNTSDGHYLEANPAASAIIELLDAGNSIAEAARAVAQRFLVEEATAREDAEALVTDCLSRGLLIRAAPGDVVPAEAAARTR